jgi:hypothetical protein
MGNRRFAEGAQAGAATEVRAATHATARKGICRYGSASQRHYENANCGSLDNRVPHNTRSDSVSSFT